MGGKDCRFMSCICVATCKLRIVGTCRYAKCIKVITTVVQNTNFFFIIFFQKDFFFIK